MSCLYTFGCSFTEGYETTNSPTYLKYKEYKGGMYPKVWPELLSEKLNLDLKNYGEGASGNQQIFVEICKRSHEFKKSDIVIIGWSFMQRYRMALDDNNWIKLGPGAINNSIPLLDSTHNEIVLNRTLRPYYNEIYDFENIINTLSKSIGFDVYYWSFDETLIYNLPKELLHQKKYLLNNLMKDHHWSPFTLIFDRGGKRIIEETDGLIDDWHMGESGHRIQAELFYEHITNFQ